MLPLGNCVRHLLRTEERDALFLSQSRVPTHIVES
jgi:hypothetical protein